MSALKDYYRQIMETAKSTISNNIVESVSDIIKMHKNIGNNIDIITLTATN
jgi:hypothetical protein